MFDVIIIGGGPAGLNAALVLGRSRRNVLVCDSGKPRNFAAKEMHGYLTRDGMDPLKFLEMGCSELKKYGVVKEQMDVVKAEKTDNGFLVINSQGKEFYSKKLLIATGIKDKLPEIDGIEEYYGISVFHCPYCDGFEVRDRRLAVYARGKAAHALSLSLKTWSNDVVLCTDGPTRMTPQDKEELRRCGIKIFVKNIKSLEGKNGKLERIVFVNDESIEADAMFFSTSQKQHSDIAEQLGCQFGNKGFIVTNIKQQTNIKGVFVAGDVTKDVKFVIVAAAEGARAGVAINIELQEEERGELITVPEEEGE